ncbi:MAG: hypothetical protein HY520_02065 [Candidatus Aenigmarchaeota archaeon]|nr:hypothetical protein [Candidatus Aenigmarchaeota archaeon]
MPKAAKMKTKPPEEQLDAVLSSPRAPLIVDARSILPIIQGERDELAAQKLLLTVLTTYNLTDRPEIGGDDDLDVPSSLQVSKKLVRRTEWRLAELWEDARGGNWTETKMATEIWKHLQQIADPEEGVAFFALALRRLPYLTVPADIIEAMRCAVEEEAVPWSLEARRKAAVARAVSSIEGFPAHARIAGLLGEEEMELVWAHFNHCERCFIRLREGLEAERRQHFVSPEDAACRADRALWRAEKEIDAESEIKPYPPFGEI